MNKKRTKSINSIHKEYNKLMRLSKAEKSNRTQMSIYGKHLSKSPGIKRLEDIIGLKTDRDGGSSMAKDGILDDTFVRYCEGYKRQMKRNVYL
jgi:hypothetical protein